MTTTTVTPPMDPAALCALMDPSAPIDGVANAVLWAASLAAEGRLSTSDAEVILSAAWEAVKDRHDLLIAANVMPSPHMVAMIALTVAGARAPEHIRTPGIGYRSSQPASLYTAIVGPPGTGKSQATGAISKGMRPLALPNGVMDCVSASGSPKTSAGLFAAYYKQASQTNPGTNRKVTVWVREIHSVLWAVDEAETFLANNNSSEPLSATMSTMWSGLDAQDSLKDKSQMLPLEEATYRSTLIIGVQPEKASGLLARKGQGFTQRGLFTRAETRRPPVVSGLLPLTTRATPSPAIRYFYRWPSEPMAYADQLPEYIEAGLAQQQPELDTHRVQLECRIGTLLAAVQGRRVIGWEDLLLAMTLVGMCRIVRDAFVVPAAKAAEEAQAAAQGKLDAVRQDARDVERSGFSDSRVAKAAAAALAGHTCAPTDPSHPLTVTAKRLSKEQRRLLAEPRSLDQVQLAMDELQPERRHMIFPATPTSPIQVSCTPRGC